MASAKASTSALSVASRSGRSLEPTAESWAQLGDREIVCLLVLPENGTFSYDAQNDRR